MGEDNRFSAMMWEPGKKIRQANEKSDIRNPRSKSRSPVKQRGVDKDMRKRSQSLTPNKKLSGATLNMRFMQRKVEAETSTARKNRIRKDEDSTINQLDDSTMKNDESEYRSGDTNSMSISAEETMNYPHIATEVDMYGIGGSIIGRRSFGGFNKSVENTWEISYKTISKMNKSSEKKKVQMSDEELLRRYEKYLKGDDTFSPKAAPIGNLEEKKNKKNRKRNREEDE